jgi:hypothetical protein
MGPQTVTGKRIPGREYRAAYATVRLTPAILMREGHDAEAIRHTARHCFNVASGGGLGVFGGIRLIAAGEDQGCEP